MLLNIQVRYAPQPDDLVGFDLCVLLCCKDIIYSQKTQNSKDGHMAVILDGFKKIHLLAFISAFINEKIY